MHAEHLEDNSESNVQACQTCYGDNSIAIVVAKIEPPHAVMRYLDDRRVHNLWQPLVNQPGGVDCIATVGRVPWSPGWIIGNKGLHM